MDAMNGYKEFFSKEGEPRERVVQIINFVKKLVRGHTDHDTLESRSDYFRWTTWTLLEPPASFSGNPYAYRIAETLDLLIHNDMIACIGKLIGTVEHVAELLERFDQNVDPTKDHFPIRYHQSDSNSLYVLTSFLIERDFLHFLFYIDTSSSQLLLYSVFGTFEFNQMNNLWSDTEEKALNKYLEANNLNYTNVLGREKPSLNGSEDDYWSRYDDEQQMRDQQVDDDAQHEEQVLVEQEKANKDALSMFSSFADETLERLYTFADHRGISAEKCENILLEKIVRMTRKKSENWIN